MADKRIGDVTHDDSIGGGEKLPMDDAGTAKYATTGDIKQYVIDQIEALTAAESVATATDKVYLLKSVSGGGSPELKPVSAETLATAVLDYGFGKAAVATVSDTDKIGVKSGSDQKTVTVDALKQYMATNVAIPWASLTEASSASDLANDDYLVFRDTSATGDKKVKVVTYKEYVCAAFKAYVEGLAGITGSDVVQNNDLVYLVHNSQSDGTVARKATISQLISAVGSGDVIAPTLSGSETWAADAAGKIPKWDTTQKTLTKGYAVQNSIRASGTAESNSIPTEAAVRGALDTKVDVVEGKQLSKNDYSDAEKAKVANAENAVSPWVAGKTYSVGQYCTYNGCLYGRKVQGSESTFTPSNWDEVPVYPSTSDETKFLRADKTWQVPPTATNFEGATGGQTPAAGKAGLVPAPTTGDINKFLRGNGNWDDPTTPCAIAPGSVTANKVPQWSGTGKALTDGLVVAKSTDDVASENEDTTIPTVGKTNELIGELGSLIVFTTDTPTGGKIPKWSDPVGETQTKSLVDGYSVVTAVGATPADTNIATEKAVADHVTAKVPYAKLADVDLTSSTTTATLVDHAVNRLLISTPTGSPAMGGTCTLTLPTATTGLSRDFYVVFVQSGTYNAVSTVNFATQVHGKSGTVSSLSLTKDVSGNSNAYHVYHFFEDNTQLWCVNVFEVSETPNFVGATSGTGAVDGVRGFVPAPTTGDIGKFLKGDGTWAEVISTGGGYVKYATQSVTATEGAASVSVQNRGVYCFSIGEEMTLTVNIPSRESGRPIDIYFGLVGSSSERGCEITLAFLSAETENPPSFVTSDGYEYEDETTFDVGASGNYKKTFIHLFEVGGNIVVDVLHEKPVIDEACSFKVYNTSISTASGGNTEISLSARQAKYVTFDGTVSEVTLYPYSWYTPLMDEGYDSVIDSYIIGTNNGETAPSIVLSSEITTVTQILLPNGVTSIGALFEPGKVVKIKCSMKFNEESECTALMFSKECECSIQQPSAS